MAIMNCGRHVYDSDQYSECPYCASGRKVMDFKTVGSIPAGNVKIRPGETVISNSAVKADYDDKYRTVPVGTVSVNRVDASRNSADLDSGRAIGKSDNTYKTVPVDSLTDKKLDDSHMSDNAGSFDNAVNEKSVNADSAAFKPREQTEKSVAEYTPPEPVSVTSEHGYLTADPKPDNPPDFSMMSLDGVRNATEESENHDSEKSVDLNNNKFSIDNRRGFSPQDNKTVGIFHKSMKREPVVGWLVCVDGELKGRDFRILAGMNTIGRGERMDICLQFDRTVSKENHARVAYDSKHNRCQLIPSEKSTNIYLNDNPVYTPAVLSHMDKVEIGESKFVYVSFCDDIYSWSEE